MSLRFFPNRSTFSAGSWCTPRSQISKVCTTMNTYFAFFWPSWAPKTGTRPTTTSGALTRWSTSAGANRQGANAGPSRFSPPLRREATPRRSFSLVRPAGSGAATGRSKDVREEGATPGRPRSWTSRGVKTGPTRWTTSGGGAPTCPNVTTSQWRPAWDSWPSSSL